MTKKRRRGRPAGTQINDDAALAKIADLLVASPEMKDSVALRTVRMAGKYKGQSPRAIEERWRTKFNDQRAVLIEAATKRRATKEARPTSGGGAYPISLASLKNPLQDALSVALGNPIGDAVARAMANPLQDAIAAAMRNPLQEAMREAQRAADQFRAAFSQVGYGPGTIHETMRKIEEQQRLMDQITMGNSYSLWPYR